MERKGFKEKEDEGDEGPGGRKEGGRVGEGGGEEEEVEVRCQKLLMLGLKHSHFLSDLSPLPVFVGFTCCLLFFLCGCSPQEGTEFLSILSVFLESCQ